LAKGRSGRRGCPRPARDRLRRQVHRDLGARRGQKGVDQRPHLRRRQRHGEEPVLQAVVVEDVAERRCDHGAETEVHQRPHGVFARGAAAEVLARHQDLAAPELRAVQREIGKRRPSRVVSPREEEPGAEPRPLQGLQVSRRDDGVGVDVSRSRGTPTAFNGTNFSIIASPPARRRCGRKPPRRPPSRGSSGASAPGSLPPLEIPVRRRGAPLAGFQPVRVHPEAHGAPREPPLEPGLDEGPVEPLLLRLPLHQPRPGTTSAVTFAWTLRPEATAAAARRSRSGRSCRSR